MCGAGADLREQKLVGLRRKKWQCPVKMRAYAQEKKLQLETPMIIKAWKYCRLRPNNVG